LTYHFEEHGKAKYFNLECWVSLQLYNNSMEKKLASMTEELSNSDIMHAFFFTKNARLYFSSGSSGTRSRQHREPIEPSQFVLFTVSPQEMHQRPTAIVCLHCNKTQPKHWRN
jgi:hypothetical protein